MDVNSNCFLIVFIILLYINNVNNNINIIDIIFYIVHNKIKTSSKKAVNGLFAAFFIS